jgi:hypothetical protein
LATGIPARLTSSQGRRFGLTVGGAFAVLAAITVFRHKPIIVTDILAGIGGLLIVAAIVIPRSLGPVERAWMGFAELLSKITTPIVMAILFSVVFVPFGILKRLFGRNALQRVRAGESAWATRTTSRGDLRRQF